MEFKLKIKNDLLVQEGFFSGVSGNANSYVLSFEFLDERYADLLWICVFSRGDIVCQRLIDKGQCTIPDEILKNPGVVEIGCYGITTTGTLSRISTNRIRLNLEEGAYDASTAPQIPEPDIWEEIVMRTVPYIGENGHWYVYCPEQKGYVDSGTSSYGYMPQKGIDYMTESDNAEIQMRILTNLLDGLTFSVSEDGIVSVEKED